MTSSLILHCHRHREGINSGAAVSRGVASSERRHNLRHKHLILTRDTVKVTSSSAMAERPCDCGVLCLRPKSSLCSCRHCRGAMQGRAGTRDVVAISQARKTRTDWPGRHNKPGRPCREHVYVTKSAFFEGVRHFRRIFHREGASVHQALLVPEN